MKFPHPVRLSGGSTRWRLSELMTYEAQQTGQTAKPLDPEGERFLSVAQVAQRYSTTPSTVWRWAADSRGQAG